MDADKWYGATPLGFQSEQVYILCEIEEWEKKIQNHALKEVTQQQWIVVITNLGKQAALQISPLGTWLKYWRCT